MNVNNYIVTQLTSASNRWQEERSSWDAAVPYTFFLEFHGHSQDTRSIMCILTSSGELLNGG